MEAHQETPDLQSSQWRALVDEVAERIEATSVALTQLRASFRQLRELRPPLVEALAAEVAKPKPSVDFTPSTADAEPGEVEASDEALRREEVRRAAEQPKLDKDTIWALDSLSSVSEGSWPSRASGPGLKPEENGHDADAARRELASEDAAREAVRRAIEQARADIEAAAGSPEADAEAISEKRPSGAEIESELQAEAEEIELDESLQEQADPDAARDGIRRAIEQFRAEMQSEAGWSTGSGGSVSEGSWPQVESKAEEDTVSAQAEHEAPPSGTWPAGDSAWSWPTSGSDRPEERARNKEPRAPEGTGAQSREDEERPGAGSDENVRDSVRRAVEQARAELRVGEDPDPGGDEATFAWPDHTDARSSDAELLLMPPSLVIEDPMGRIELARVYETLSRLDFASEASLLNYTAHSVTVGLGPSTTMPDVSAVSAAVKAAFGRACSVSLDGARISARIGNSSAEAA